MQECDLVMKGGITSGVVYPKAITEIAKTYRLRQIGGTSAGAIAAAFAAAAEFRRQKEIERDGDPMAGFTEIEARAIELGGSMKGMFQPAAQLESLHRMMMAALSEKAKKSGAGIPMMLAFLRSYWMQTGGILLLCAIGIAIGYQADNVWMAIAICLAATMLATFLIVRHFLSLASRGLRDNDFGICSGKTNEGCDQPAFGDWIRRSIDAISGEIGRPLTVGDLKGAGVDIAAMTTDLSSGRPYQLPMKTRIHAFRKSEFERLFEPVLVEYLCRTGGRFDATHPDAPDDLYRLPCGDAFPVYLVARMSLSFPGLISAVPLWREDFGAGEEPYPVRRCLFSDGGISSNFPIHFFDSLLPRRPTFGISLDSWEASRDGDDRVSLPQRGRQTTMLKARRIDSLPAFLLSIVNTAKDWQDTLQSMLPGYAERIVTIKLDPTKEGGMNLQMDRDLIAELQEYGRQAGEALVTRFSYDHAEHADDGSRLRNGFDQHRYDRAISLLPKMEGALAGFDYALDHPPLGASTDRTGRWVLTTFPTANYPQPDKWRQEPIASFADGLAGLGRIADEQGADPDRRNLRQLEKMPVMDADIRLAVHADREPGDQC